ncbi:MAG: 1-acyl-sn-glycerol-3-phosphate acyltransferase [Chloroflexi bacterium]|nr:1-acyl-sn-glycerol-3-phosphate acyltransferase [Chloroflexota bacterium]
MPTAERRRSLLPRSDLAAWRRTLRYYIARLATGFVMRILFGFRIEGRDRLARQPAIYCFNHGSWTDPFVLMTVLPLRPRLFFFGPKEEDMTEGGRNRLMHWTGTTVPFKPGKDDLLETTRRVAAVLDAGGVLAIAGEGRIHPRERDLFPLEQGTAYFALRSRVPIIPLAVNGNSWLHFRGRIRVRVGEPIGADGRPTREAIATLTERVEAAFRELIADAPEATVSRGTFGRLTEMFNDWGEGSPEAAERARQRTAARRARRGG